MRPFASRCFEDVARKIFFVETLHNNDVSALFRVVKSCRQRIVPPFESAVANEFRLHFDRVVRIVHDDDASAFTGQRTANRCCEPITACVVVESNLGVLIRGDGETIAPTLLIPRAFDEASSLR